MRKVPTIKDVAEYANVSTATVTRVIQASGYVSEETYQRVQEAIRATNYRVNSVAQSLRRQRTCIIGHVLHSTFPNTFYVQVALGAEKFALKKGYNILTYNVQGNPVTERKSVESFIHRRVDGILFTTPLDLENVQCAASAGIPVVQVERPLTTEVSHVTVDNYVGGVAAMEHLIQLGHRRIAFIGQNPNDLENPNAGYVERERLSAYIDTLKHYNLPVDERLIAFGKHYSLDDRGALGAGYRSAHRFLGMELGPTAIFATSDIPAAGVLQAIYEHGLRVPDDISVIGFDDTYSAFLAPLLTTVRLPMQALGETATQIVIECLEDPEWDPYTPRTKRLSTELIIRNSTGLVKAR